MAGSNLSSLHSQGPAFIPASRQRALLEAVRGVVVSRCGAVWFGARKALRSTEVLWRSSYQRGAETLVLAERDMSQAQRGPSVML